MYQFMCTKKILYIIYTLNIYNKYQVKEGESKIIP